MPLPIKPQFYPGESLGSIIVRSASLIRYTNPVRMFDDLGCRKLKLEQILTFNPASPEGVYVRDLLEISAEDFAQMAYGTTNRNRVRLCGHEVRFDQTAIYRPRFCPLCLSTDDPFRRAAWDLRAICVCPEHAVRLVERCPVCMRLQDWTMMDVAHCSVSSCFADLRQAVPIPVECAEVGGSMAVISRLALPADTLYPFGPGHLDDWLELAIALAMFERDGRARFAMHDMFAAEGTSRLLTRGLAMLDDWPASFHRLLERQRQNADDRPFSYGFRKEFGELGAWLQRGPNPAYADFLRDAVQGYFAEHADLALRRNQQIRFGKTKRPQVAYSLSDARDLLHVSLPRILLLTERHGLTRDETSRVTGHPGFLSGDRVRALQRSDQQQLDVKQLSGVLGIRPHQADHTWTRLITAIPENERVRSNVIVTVHAVRRFLIQLEAKLLPACCPSLLSLPTAARSRTDLVQVCEAILRNELTPRGIAQTATGLGRILVDPADVTAVLKRTPLLYSITEAARAYHIAGPQLHRWIQLGLIEARTRVSARGAGTCIERRSMEQFLATHIWGDELARELKISMMPTKPLRKIGVQPVSGPAVDGGTQYVFLRSDIARLDRQEFARVVGAAKRAKADRLPQLRARLPETRRFVAAIASDAAAATGCLPVKQYNLSISTDGKEVLRVVTAQRRTRANGVFTASLRAAHIHQFLRAERAWMAITLVGHPDYILIPWHRVADQFASMSGRSEFRFRIPLTPDGLIEGVFAEFSRPVPNSNGG